MMTLLPLLLAAAPAPGAYPRTALVSVVELPLRKGESVAGFSFSMWGVDIKAVCRIPTGWKIKAGGDSTPDAELSGEGSKSATWFKQKSPAGLHDLVLVRLRAPVQQKDERKGDKVVSATFKGVAVISTDDGERRGALTYQNIALRPAVRCPDNSAPATQAKPAAKAKPASRPPARKPTKS